MIADLVDRFQRIPFRPANDGRVESHSGLTRHYPTLAANFVAGETYSREVGILMAHPASSFITHFLLRGLAERGLPMMAVNTRYTTNEPALIMERAADDLGQGVRWMREELGFEKVILLGFSGGGSLASFYQSQALSPTVTRTPAGDPVDLGECEPADGLVLVGAHPGRARVLRHWIDAAVTDEADPYATDPDLDLYAPDRTVPLDREWVSAYRDAQLARVRRIDAWALEQIERLEKTGASDRAFVVHRTVGDPRFVDVTLDPSDRRVGSMYGDPQAANSAAGGLARFATARSWLSTWSFDHTHADALRNLTTVTTPTQVVCLRADQAAFVSDSDDMARASGDPYVSHVELDDLNHYLVDQPDGVTRIAETIGDWLPTRGFGVGEYVNHRPDHHAAEIA
ncbi:MAG: alpha/beta hydrolase [Corynebacteriales bacterium]|nr:alpha/beta hydrolase [Mycobacteriales bacterium]